MSRMHWMVVLSVAMLGLSAPLSAFAKTPQNLSATVNGKVFESDDDGILYLVPTKGVLNLSSLIFYLSLIAFWLFATVVVVDQHKAA